MSWELQGRWYITAGLNPLFDQFDCQEHYFGVPEPGSLFHRFDCIREFTTHSELESESKDPNDAA